MAEKETMKIVVDDGSIKVPIENKYGDEIGSFYFRPTDTGMYTRYVESMNRIEDVVEPLKNAQIKPDGTADESVDGSIDAVMVAQERLYELCDYIFGGNFSEAFFGRMAPFSPIGGKFYFEIALDNLGSFIEKQCKEETKKVVRRVSRYTAKYEKGKNT